MYGLVNRAVQDLVTDRFGEVVWDRVKARAGVQEATFVTMSAYPDQVTYDLVAAASAELEADPEQILEQFGEYWMEYSAHVGYGDLLTMMGEDLPTFLDELDHMHDRLRLSFPHLRPPSIYLTDRAGTDPVAGTGAGESFVVHYVSDRDGLTPFFVGLLRGAARRFGRQVIIEQRAARATGADHDEFVVLTCPDLG